MEAKNGGEKWEQVDELTVRCVAEHENHYVEVVAEKTRKHGSYLPRFDFSCKKPFYGCENVRSRSKVTIKYIEETT